MRILDKKEELGPGERCVVTVGNFDGVHRGHWGLLSETVLRARRSGSSSAAVTFEPHTRHISPFAGDDRLLTTLEEKARLIELAGIDYLLVLPFDRAMTEMGPRDFVEQVLSRRLHMGEWVMGRGHAIGSNRAGDEKVLRDLGGKYHFTLVVTDLWMLNGKPVSSTQARDAVTKGRIAEAVEMLGHPYLISVERIRGKRLGAQLGFPTLNFKSPPSRKVIPPPGVYAAELEFRGILEQGALYFGECPTLHELRDVHFEFHSFHRGGEEPAEGARAHLWLSAFIRNDAAFSDTGELARNIARDVETIREFFTKEKRQWR